MKKRETRQNRFKEKQDKIIKEETREKRKKRALKLFKFFGILCLFLLCFFSYVTMIGTTSMVVQEEKIVSSSLPSSFHGLKIIVFSDLHYPSTFLKQELKTLKREIEIRKPDLILFGGDLFTTEKKVSEKQKSEIHDFLEDLDATLGKYAVLGETDKDDAKTLLESTGFQVLNDTFDLIYRNDKNPILLIGIDSRQKVPNFEQAFSYFKEENANQEIYTIALFHHPDTMTSVSNTKEVDLAIAGHSHHGQVRIPFLAPLGTKKGASTYPDSYYEIGKTKFYITSGLGTSGYHYRFFARPSILFFRLTTS